MTVYWIDVCDAHGVALGDGPILSATDWTHTSNLDKAGSFAFSMPRDDPRAALVQPKRIVTCWAYADGKHQHLGSGIVNDVRTSATPDGRALLAVSGDNLLAELLNRIIPFDTFNEDHDIHPVRVWMDAGTAPEVNDLQVGDTTTYKVYGSNVVLLVRSPVKYKRLTFVLQSAQTNPGTPTFEYQTRDGGVDLDGDGTVEGTQWVAFTPTVNTTITGSNVWFGQSGYIEWDLEDLSGWELRNADLVPGVQEITYAIRITPPVGGWSSFGISDISIRVTEPTNDALGRIMAYAPAGWTLDAGNGYTTLQNLPIYGDNLITSNAGFETYTGTPNDATSDSWADWNVTSDDPTGNSVLADTSTKHSGSASAKFTHGLTGTSYAGLTRYIDVQPSTEYTITYWTRTGANSGQIGMGLYSTTPFEVFYLADSGVTSATWTEVTTIITTPIECSQILLYFVAPTAENASAYVDDVDVRCGGGKAIALDSQGETVLENLVRIASTTGEHFSDGPDPRQVLWLGRDVRDSGLRAVAYTDAVAAEGCDDICLIASLTEVVQGQDLVSRVYPYGGGSEPVPTLRNVTRPVPAGFTLDRTNNYLERDQSVAAYGRIERRLDASDVTNVSGDPSGDVHSCNMLFDRTYLYLVRHSATNLSLDGGDLPRSYQLELVKCARLLLPGYTLRLEYDRYVQAVRTMHVWGDFWITSATVRADASGVHTVAVRCSTVDQAPRDNNSFVVDLARTVRGMKAHQ